MRARPVNPTSIDQIGFWISDFRIFGLDFKPHYLHYLHPPSPIPCTSMDITNFVVSARNQALLYGDYNTYHKQLVKKLHNCRKRLNIVTKNRGKFSKKDTITAEKLAENHEYAQYYMLDYL